MGFETESDPEASLVIGPTSLGMVRILVESGGSELPMDFEPDEALEIAEELRAAAERARATAAALEGGRRPTDGGARGNRGGRGA